MTTLKELKDHIREGLNGQHDALVEKHRAHLPTFLIIGAAKSGTTSLGATLMRHPQVFLTAKPKEPKFFGLNYDRGWDWYARLFSRGNAATKAARGEASTMYSSELNHFKSAAKLMRLYLPDLKLIYLTRHPLERIVSQWRHIKGKRADYLEFNDIYSDKRAAKMIIGCSEYFARISSFRKEFPDNQILPITFEDLVLNPSSEIRRVLKFLNIEEIDLIGNQGLAHENQAGTRKRNLIPMPDWEPRFKRRVIAELESDTSKYLNWIGKPKDYWLLQ